MVSIIVPIYNAEKYLDFCLESIVSQDYKELQIILINDGSTDDSLKVMKNWEQKDNRINIYCQENSGQGVARNNGLKYATGEYVMFVDADDWLETECVSELLGSIEKNNSDVSIGLIAKTKLDSVQTAFVLKECDYNIVDGDILKENLFKITTYPHARIIKKQIFDINHIQFPQHKFEDVAMMPLLYALSSSISFVKKVVYHYRNNSGSTVNNISMINDRIICIDSLMQEFKNRGLYEIYKKQLIEYIIERCQINLRCVKSLSNNLYISFNEKQNRYINKLGLQIWKIPKVVVYGSYNLMITAKIFMQLEDTATLDDYYGGESIISCMSEKYELLLDTSINHKNAFRNKCIINDFEKAFVHMNPGRFRDVDYIFIDLLEERFDIGKNSNNEYFTISDYFVDIIDSIGMDFEIIKCFSKEWFDLWEKAVEKFIERLKIYVQEKKIIIIKNKLSEKYYDENGDCYFDNYIDISKTNDNLEKCYKLIEEKCPEAVFFDFSNLDMYKTSKSFRHGGYSWHLNEAVYLEMARLIKYRLYVEGI